MDKAKKKKDLEDMDHIKIWAIEMAQWLTTLVAF